MPTQIADNIVSERFTQNVAKNSLASTAFYESGVVAETNLMKSYLQDGAPSFTVPFWNDLSDSYEI